MDAVLAVGGIAAGLYALLSGKKETAPPSVVDPIIQKAVPIVQQQIAAGVPKPVALQAAAVAVVDTSVDQIVKANSCVLLTFAGASKTNPYSLPDAVVQELRKRGWETKSTYKTPPPPSAPKPGASPWETIASTLYAPTITLFQTYLCPPGKTPPTPQEAIFGSGTK